MQTSNYRENNTGRNKVSPSKLPRIGNLKTVDNNGLSVFIFADLREVKKCLRSSSVFVLIMFNDVHRTCDCWEFPIVDSVTRDPDARSANETSQ
jgi:hypothetical protein